MEKAVLDRIAEGNFAVLLVGENEKEVIIDKNRLPDGAEAGSHLLVDIQNGDIITLKLDTASTKAAKQRIENKMDMLRKRKKKG